MVQIGKIEQLTILTNNERVLDLSKPFDPKILTISTLKKLREDYLLTNDDEASDKVIDWLINCTPNYKV